MRKTFMVAALGAAVLVAGAGSALAAPSHATAPKATKSAISVAASDFKFKLSKTSVAKGTTVTFTVENTSSIEHNFKIDGKVTPMIKGGKSAKLVVAFTKAGKFPYSCTVPGHAAAGMKGTFTVK